MEDHKKSSLGLIFSQKIISLPDHGPTFPYNKQQYSPQLALNQIVNFT